MTIVPPSIRRFRLVYGLVVLLTAVNVVLLWPGISATLARYPELSTGGRSLVVLTVLAGLAIPVLIWWFAGWRRSRVARIALVVVVLAALIFVLRALASGVSLNLRLAISLAGFVLQVASLWLLFRPDARGWFARTGLRL